MRSLMITLITIMASVSFAQLSTKLNGSLKSYEYNAEQSGFNLVVTGKAAEVLYKSIQAQGGIIDTELHTIVKGKLTTNMKVIISESMSCSEDVTDLKPIKKQGYKYEYSCELDISKKGVINVPARG